MIVNLDLDDVVFDFSDNLRRWLGENMGGKYADLTPPHKYSLIETGWFDDADEQREAFRAFTGSGGYADLSLLDPSTPDRIARWQDDGVRVRVITARGTRGGQTAVREQNDTLASLQAHGIAPDEVIFANNKADFACDLAIDDADYQILQYRRAGIDAIIMHATHNLGLAGDRARDFTHLDSMIRERGYPTLMPASTAAFR